MKMCQARHFWKEMDGVNAENRLPRISNINWLNPFLDKDGVLSVGGKTCELKLEPWAEASRFNYQILHHITIDHQVLSWKDCTLRKRDDHRWN